jgi:hypothetical protein
MKKKLIITASALSLCALCLLPAKIFYAGKPVNKNINFEVYKNASYVSPAYAHAFATLQVTIVRVKGNKKDTVWEHTYQPKELKDYPASDKPMVQKITIPNVNDKKEKLEVYYRIIYNAQGSVLNMLNTTTIGKGEQLGKLNIQI